MSAWRMGRLRLAGVGIVGCLALGLLGAASALAEEAKFSFTGAQQEFKVPAGVTSVNVVAVGAKGLNFSSTPVGLGARVQGSIAVTPGHTLYVEVGGEGKKAVAAFNGGAAGAGGGGGASDVREVSIGAEPSPGGETSLQSRLIVAGGGGGQGASTLGCNSFGFGGSAEQSGRNGETCQGFPGGEGGGAGSQTEGGKGGSGSFASGKPGGLGRGGEGFGGVDGGGGGGGLYGGGGGGTSEFAGGGGGGGSNLVPSGGEAKLAEGEASSVTITYTALPTSIQQCKKNGWKNFGTKFKNQGQCVKFVEENL